MPDDRIKISALPSALLMDNTDVFPVVQGMTGDSKATKKAAVTLIAAHLLETMQHNNLDTTDKTIIGAINEVAETLEGLYPIADESGPIANFETELSRPLEALKIGIVATQESGTPTPSSPKAISGWSEVYLKHCKKNWFDKDNAPIVNGYIDTSSFSTSNTKARTAYIKIPSGCTVTVSKILSARFSVATAKDIPANNVAWTNRVVRSTDTNITITAGSEDRYLWIWFYLIDTDTEPYDDVLNSIQVELGYIATEFEPYVGNEYIINLGGTYYGGHLTQDKAGHRQFEVTHKISDLGDYTYTRGNYQGIDYFRTSISDSSNNNFSYICDVYTPVANVSGVVGLNSNYTFFIYTNGYLYIRNDDYITAYAFKTAMQGHKIVYELATPVIIDLPDGVPIETFIGVNNIFADSGDILKCKYKDTIQHYIDTQIAATQALIL